MNLNYLRPLYERSGPWVSIYLDATRTSEDGGHEVGLRWQALRGRLAEQGADEATLDAVSAAVEQHPYQPGRYGLAIFASDGEVAYIEELSAPPPADEAWFEPLPHAMPLVVQRGEHIPYVRVVADRTGADLEAFSVDGTQRRRRVSGGETFPIRKVQAGGWSHRRYQQAAEEAWKRNAGDVAAAAVDLAEAVGAEVVVVGGDVRAVQMFGGQLPRRWQDRLVRTDAGSRHAGADESGFEDVAVQAVADLSDRHTRDAIERYEAQRGTGSASTGLADVVTRLQRGQVDTVLLIDDQSSTDVLYVAPDDPTLVDVDPEVLRQSGVPDPRRVRADSALLSAIACTGADLVLVGEGEVKLDHGIGAVLRYADGDTAAS